MTALAVFSVRETCCRYDARLSEFSLLPPSNYPTMQRELCEATQRNIEALQALVEQAKQREVRVRVRIWMKPCFAFWPECALACDT